MSRVKTEVIVSISYVPLPPEQVPAWRESARILLDLGDQYYRKLAAGEIDPMGVPVEMAKAEKAAFRKASRAIYRERRLGSVRSCDRRKTDRWMLFQSPKFTSIQFCGYRVGEHSYRPGIEKSEHEQTKSERHVTGNGDPENHQGACG